MLQPVTDLSDDDGDHTTPALVPLQRCGSELSADKREPPCKRLKLSGVGTRPKDEFLSTLAAKTRATVQSVCRCGLASKASNCFRPFRERDDFERLVAHIRRMRKIDKMEFDKEARHCRLLWFAGNIVGLMFDT